MPGLVPTNPPPRARCHWGARWPARSARPTPARSEPAAGRRRGSGVGIGPRVSAGRRRDEAGELERARAPAARRRRGRPAGTLGPGRGMGDREVDRQAPSARRPDGGVDRLPAVGQGARVGGVEAGGRMAGAIPAHSRSRTMIPAPAATARSNQAALVAGGAEDVVGEAGGQRPRRRWARPPDGRRRESGAGGRGGRPDRGGDAGTAEGEQHPGDARPRRAAELSGQSDDCVRLQARRPRTAR